MPIPGDIDALLQIGERLATLTEKRNAIRAKQETRSERRLRTANLIISTILTAGSLVTAVITPWTLVATPIGIVRLIRGVEKDAAEENRQRALRHELDALTNEIVEVEKQYLALKAKVTSP